VGGIVTLHSYLLISKSRFFLYATWKKKLEIGTKLKLIRIDDVTPRAGPDIATRRMLCWKNQRYLILF